MIVTMSHLGLVTVVVDDYDRAIAHYVDDLVSPWSTTSIRATSVGSSWRHREPHANLVWLSCCWREP